MDIETLLRLDAVLPKNKARLLMGPAGIGKSSVVKHLAEKNNARLIDIRLSEFEPQDLVGLPYLCDDGDEKVTRFARPYWWPVSPLEKVYILLDELDRCREDMHPSAMQLALDRRAGGRKLHDNVIIWAACNGEDYLTIPIDQALMDRFAVVNLDPSHEDWIKWARKNKVSKTVIDFIKQNPNMLDTPDNLIGKPNTVSPSRRSWADYGQMLLDIDIAKEKSLLSFGAAFLGYDASAAFTRWTRESYQVISSEDIFQGNLEASDYDILNVACAADDAADGFLTRKEDEQYNCLSFFKDAGHEAFANLFEALPQEASSVVRSFEDIDKYINTMRKQVIKSIEQDEV